MLQGHVPPPGQLTEQRTHVFTAVTMAGLQQGKSDDGGNHDGNDDCALVCGDHDQKEVE